MDATGRQRGGGDRCGPAAVKRRGADLRATVGFADDERAVVVVVVVVVVVWV